ncbi:MAG: glycoside hydrolase family 3 C-terminal domain-containing protein [Clostridia bacterium]|nr:glycoside hydrolase family 3 C-terminal domain-containing protein [Clostridia bacterium]
MVLLKNTGGALPLKGGKVALFGKNSYELIAGGGGSGTVTTEYKASLYDGFSDKEKEGKISLFKPLSRFYLDKADAFRQTAGEKVKYIYAKEPTPPKKLISDAAKACAAAVITIGRYSREGGDREASPGDYYLGEDEIKLINAVCESFSDITVVLNIGSAICCEELEKNKNIKAILCAWQPGMEGGYAAADILCGDADPCGKLVDTFAKDYKYYPSAADYKKSPLYMDYTEDIYVGYRYFETIPKAADKVRYEFGFGLSYTTFDIKGVLAGEEDGYITVAATVTNTGKYDGKEVVQLYLSAPQGKLGKPARELCAFKKTKLLRPGESQALALRFKLSDFASFDDLGKIKKSAYVLEKGEYSLYLGASVRKCEKLGFSVKLSKDIICEKLTSRCRPFELKRRMLSDGKYEKLPTGKVTFGFDKHKPLGGRAPKDTLYFEDVTEDHINDFIAQMTDEELIHMVSGTPNRTYTDDSCFPGLARLHVPDVPTADGPAGLRIEPRFGNVFTTSFPVATAQACSWDPELVERIGAAGAIEARENNVGIFLTPALNIHRDPLCGRNFEYYSEDPVIAGTMAAAQVRGIQSQKTAASAKHFAVNSKEDDRFHCDSRVSERALREIYLKGFEICVKTAQPWTVMSSYNVLNGVHTSESRDLLQGILRGEWGFSGMVTSDWNGPDRNQVNEVRAGNDVRMSRGFPEKLAEAMASGELKRADFEHCVKRTLLTYLKLYND